MEKISEERLRRLVGYLLYEKYKSEFEIIDGIIQHKSGLSYSEWINDIIDGDF